MMPSAEKFVLLQEAWYKFLLKIRISDGRAQGANEISVFQCLVTPREVDGIESIKECSKWRETPPPLSASILEQQLWQIPASPSIYLNASLSFFEDTLNRAGLPSVASELAATFLNVEGSLHPRPLIRSILFGLCLRTTLRILCSPFSFFLLLFATRNTLEWNDPNRFFMILWVNRVEKLSVYPFRGAKAFLLDFTWRYFAQNRD